MGKSLGMEHLKQIVWPGLQESELSIHHNHILGVFLQKCSRSQQQTRIHFNECKVKENLGT